MKHARIAANILGPYADAIARMTQRICATVDQLAYVYPLKSEAEREIIIRDAISQLRQAALLGGVTRNHPIAPRLGNRGRRIKMTNHPNRSHKQIRQQILARDGVQKVKITRNGEIHAYGNMPRGDGGEKPWWQFIGTIKDAEYI